jgi:hypothetical protein
MTERQLYWTNARLCRPERPTALGALLDDALGDLLKLKPVAPAIQEALVEVGGEELAEAVRGVGLARGGRLTLEFADPATAYKARITHGQRLLAVLKTKKVLVDEIKFALENTR